MPEDPQVTAAKTAFKGLWTVENKLGEGAFGTVMRVTRISDKAGAACKIMVVPADIKEKEAIDKEIKMMKAMNHPYIVKCMDSTVTPTHAFLILELMGGGELFDKIVNLARFNETMAADYTHKLLLALQYMHEKGFVHRDLKPENMLLKDKTGDDVKLTDFGLSHIMDSESSLMTVACGTPAYVAPEVLTINKNGGYDHQVDVWSMGVIVYILLCGYPPFYGKTDNELFAMIKSGNYKFRPEDWDPISSAGKDFVRKMLTVNPKQRAQIPELLKHQWLISAKARARKRGSVFAPIFGGGKEEEEVNLKAGKHYDIKAADAAARLARNNLATYRAAKQIKRFIAKKRAEKWGGAEPEAVGGITGFMMDVMPFDTGMACCATPRKSGEKVRKKRKVRRNPDGTTTVVEEKKQSAGMFGGWV